MSIETVCSVHFQSPCIVSNLFRIELYFWFELPLRYNNNDRGRYYRDIIVNLKNENYNHIQGGPELLVRQKEAVLRSRSEMWKKYFIENIWQYKKLLISIIFIHNGILWPLIQPRVYGELGCKMHTWFLHRSWTFGL